jgi:hypothetical protein
MEDRDDADIRLIAIDLLDEVLQEGRDAWNGIDEEEYDDAQVTALEMFGEGHDPKMLVRALIIAIADRLSDGMRTGIWPGRGDLSGREDAPEGEES